MAERPLDALAQTRDRACLSADVRVAHWDGVEEKRAQCGRADGWEGRKKVPELEFWGGREGEGEARRMSMYRQTRRAVEVGREQAIREACTGVSMWCDARVSIEVCVHGDAREGGPGPHKVGNER